MRGLAIVGLLAVLGIGAWFALNSSEPALRDPTAGADGPGSERLDETFRPDADPQRATIESGGERPPAPDEAPPPTTPATRSIPVRALDGDGNEVRGFVIDALPSPAGVQRGPRRLAAENSRDALSLSPGEHTLRLRHPEFAAPPPQRVRVTTDGPREIVFRLGPRIGVVMLRVLDQSTKAPVPGFRLTLTTKVPGRAPRKSAIPRPEAQPFRLECPRNGLLEVQVEAPGYTPAEPKTFSFEAMTPPREETVYLAAVMKFSGVEFQVQDRLGTPIPHLLVQTDQQDAGQFKKLWSRRTSATNGVYKLPDLAPGNYRMRLVSIDAEGQATLHQGYEFTCTITGNEHIVQPVQLQDGGNIELRARNPAGQTIGKGVNISLVQPDGTTVIDSVWQALVDGKPAPNTRLTADHLQHDGPARLHRSLPPGDYTLKLSYRAGPVVTRPVRVVGGDSTLVEVVLTPGQ